MGSQLSSDLCDLTFYEKVERHLIVPEVLHVHGINLWRRYRDDILGVVSGVADRPADRRDSHAIHEGTLAVHRRSAPLHVCGKLPGYCLVGAAARQDGGTPRTERQ